MFEELKKKDQRLESDGHSSKLVTEAGVSSYRGVRPGEWTFKHAGRSLKGFRAGDSFCHISLLR